MQSFHTDYHTSSSAPKTSALKKVHRFRSGRGMTLVEVMVSMSLLTTFMLGFLGTFIQSRKLTESSVLHAAATSLVYGIIEQLKMADYSSLPDANSLVSGLRLNQDQVFNLTTVYTTSSGTPQGPTTTPDPSALSSATATIIPLTPLSSVSGTNSQQLAVKIWLWIDDIPLISQDVVDAKKLTLVYTYTFNDGAKTRTICDREVFLRTRYDQ